MTTRMTEGVQTLFGAFVSVFDNLHSSFSRGKERGRKRRGRKLSTGGTPCRLVKVHECIIHV